MAYRAWKLVDDGYFPRPICRACDQPLTRSYEDGSDSTPLEKDCPNPDCRAVLRLED